MECVSISIRRFVCANVRAPKTKLQNLLDSMEPLDIDSLSHPKFGQTEFKLLIFVLILSFQVAEINQKKKTYRLNNVSSKSVL